MVEMAHLAEANESTTESKRQSKLKLVVIDDDPANLKLARFVLKNEGIEIHSATDSQSGMDLIRQIRPQVVLLDLVIPGVQGMELLQKILEFDPGIDVILMTGYY
jgi:DNA-binding NtrC family response regulator